MMLRPAALVVAITLGLSCEGNAPATTPTEPDQPTEPSQPTPGHMQVSLTSTVRDGILVLELRGPKPGDPKLIDRSYQFFWERVDLNTIRAILVGDVRSGILFSVQVNDTALAYEAVVLEAADNENHGRERLEGYALRVVPQR
jgi:hypothetical protein